MDNTEDFRSVFNQIEDHLRKITDSEANVGFARLVDLASVQDGLVRTFERDLKQFGDLRNAIVHAVDGRFLANPSEKSVEKLRYIYKLLTRPPTAFDIATQPVETCDLNSSILEVVQKMVSKDFTNIPVLSSGQFVGVFSESSVVRWLGDSGEKGGFILDRTKIDELRKYFDSPEGKFGSYKFTARSVSAYDIRNEFLALTVQKKRLGAVFVTEHGDKKEKILGIITAWDLPRIEKLVED
ncbi:MAG: CBS domain-containing protein [Candidatus Pacebacteria bacterium]|nr:CBS domain-containing protein [Candidatus Paceibacterota bacterium]